MANNAMPYGNPQSPAIPKQEPDPVSAPPKRQPNDHPNQMDKGSGTKQAFENEGAGHGDERSGVGKPVSEDEDV